MRQVARVVRSEPGEPGVSRRVERDASVLHEEHTVCVRERSRRPLLRDDDGAAYAIEKLEELVGGGGIELGRRLVEQEELRPECERRGETDALELSA